MGISPCDLTCVLGQSIVAIGVCSRGELFIQHSKEEVLTQWGLGNLVNLQIRHPVTNYR